MALKLALYGYDTDLGKLVIETLEDSTLEVDAFYPLTPLSGEFDAIKLHGRNYLIENIEDFDFSTVDVALFLTTKDETQRLSTKAREAGAIVIDLSHLYSGDGKVPLILPEINPEDVVRAVETRLAVPASSVSTALTLVLHTLHDAYEVKQAVATVLESVSEHGRFGTETLARETAFLLNGRALEESGFEAQVAFNLHTRIGKSDAQGEAFEEKVIKSEVTRLLGGFSQGLSVTALMVPVFFGHTLCLHVTLGENVSLEDLKTTLEESEHLELLDDSDELITPVTHSVSAERILVTRVRMCGPRSCDLMVLFDNARRGEAVNCVALLKLIAAYLKK